MREMNLMAAHYRTASDSDRMLALNLRFRLSLVLVKSMIRSLTARGSVMSGRVPLAESSSSPCLTE
jgi:hypothetical protein